jgi:hypothetical protein
MKFSTHNDRKPEILPSIITFAPGGGEYPWRDFVDEFPRANLHRVALFLTGLDAKGRERCFETLSRTLASYPFTVPFVHARDDMHPDEYALLMEKFGTERFNLHAGSDKPPIYDLPEDLRQRIYIENHRHLTRSDLIGYAGICLDFAHLEMARLNNTEYYNRLVQLLDLFPIGANHVSAITSVNDKAEDIHVFRDLSEFDYLRSFPRSYVADFVAIELAEPLEKQLQVKAMLEEMWRL